MHVLSSTIHLWDRARVRGCSVPCTIVLNSTCQLLLSIVQIVTYLVEVCQCGLISWYSDSQYKNIMPILIANPIYNFVQIFYFSVYICFNFYTQFSWLPIYTFVTLPIANFWLIYDRLSNYWCNSNTQWTLARWCSCMCTFSPSYLSPHLHVPPPSHLHHAHLHRP